MSKSEQRCQNKFVKFEIQLMAAVEFLLLTWRALHKVEAHRWEMCERFFSVPIYLQYEGDPRPEGVWRSTGFCCWSRVWCLQCLPSLGRSCLQGVEPERPPVPIQVTYLPAHPTEFCGIFPHTFYRISIDCCWTDVKSFIQGTLSPLKDYLCVLPCCISLVSVSRGQGERDLSRSDTDERTRQRGEPMEVI